MKEYETFVGSLHSVCFDRKHFFGKHLSHFLVFGMTKMRVNEKYFPQSRENESMPPLFLIILLIVLFQTIEYSSIFLCCQFLTQDTHACKAKPNHYFVSHLTSYFSVHTHIARLLIREFRHTIRWVLYIILPLIHMKENFVIVKPCAKLGLLFIGTRNSMFC